MIVEPVPTNPRSPLGRGLRLAGIVLPVVLLVGVVAAGALGPRPAEPPAVAGADATSPRPSVRLDAPPPGAVSPRVAAGPGTPSSPTDPWPTVVADLAVRTVREALAIRDRDGPGRMLAVAGHLAVPAPPDCPDQPAGGLGPRCERQGMLLERPWVTSGGGVFAPVGPHLHARIPVPVRLAEPVAATVRGAGGGPVPVVVVGRFEPGGGACRDVESDCEAGFLVDRLAWVDGAELPVRPVVDAGIDGDPAERVRIRRLDAEIAAIGWSGTVLVSALLRPETVARVDPAAAGALDERATRPVGPVWYVRGLETDYDPTRYPLGESPPRLRWILLDDVTGELLATGH